MAWTLWAAQVFKTKITANDATAQEQLGMIRNEYDSTNWNRKFMYIQYTWSVASAANWSVVYRLWSATDATWTSVTDDVSDSDINAVAWVAVWALTDDYYGWVQIWGYHSAVKTNWDDDIAAWDLLIWGWDGTCNSVAQDTAPTNVVLWRALAADVDAANTVAAEITVWAGL